MGGMIGWLLGFWLGFDAVFVGLLSFGAWRRDGGQRQADRSERAAISRYLADVWPNGPRRG